MSQSSKEQHLEYFALAAVVIGLLLLVDIGAIFEALTTAIAHYSPVVLLGLILFFGGLLFLAYRLRVRFLRSAWWRSTACPRCGGQFHRIHRHWHDRLLSKTVLPHARRYRCDNETCRWTGLRHATH